MSLLPYNAVELPKEEEDQFLIAIDESEILRKTSLEKLRNMIKDKEFNPSLEEKFLLSYLRASEFNCDTAAYNIQIFYEIQRESPECFEMCVLDALTKSYLNPCRVSPFRLKDNSLLVIHQYFKIDVFELPIPEKIYLDTISNFYLLLNPVTQICGMTLLVDAADLTLSKLPHYTNYKWITLGVNLIQYAPVRIKKIHIVNVSEAAIAGYNIVLPFIPKKIVDILQFHSDNTGFKDLHEFLPPESLPEKYGGHLKECELINCMENILKKEEHFRKYFPLDRRN